MWTKKIFACLMFASALPAMAQMTRLPTSTLSIELRSRIDRLNSAAVGSSNERYLSASPRQLLEIQSTNELDRLQRDIAQELIGKGFDLWSGTTFTRCVAPKSITRRPVPANGSNLHNVYNVREIETFSEYQEDRSSGANASISYKLLSFGGGTSESAGSVFKKTNKYIDIYIRFVGDEYAANEGSPTTAAIDALKGPQANSRFASLCGQQFISRVGFGVSLDGRLAAEVAIDGNSQKNKTEVNVGFKNLLSFGADSASEIQRINQHATLATSIFGTGGTQPKPEELMEYARRFGENNPASTASQEIYIETTPYAQVAYRIFAHFDDLAMRAAGTVLDLGADRAASLQQRSELDTAIAHPGFFQVNGVSKTAAELAALRKLDSDYLDKLGDVWNVCRKALDEQGIKACRNAVPPSSARPATLEINLANQIP